MESNFACECCHGDIRSEFVSNYDEVEQRAAEPVFDMTACIRHITNYAWFCPACVRLLGRDH